MSSHILSIQNKIIFGVKHPTSNLLLMFTVLFMEKYIDERGDVA